MIENPNAIEKSLLILNEFAKPPYKFTAVSLSDRLKITKPTVHRILNTLEKYNYLRKTSNNGEYCISYNAYNIGMVYANYFDVYREISSIVDDVSKLLGHQVGYAILDGLAVVSLYESQCNDVHIRYMSGAIYTINCGCYGKVLMANSYPIEELHKIVPTIKLEQFGAKSIMDHDILLKEYEKTLKMGYGMSDGEFLEGTIGVGAPTFNKNGTVHGCIALSVLKTPSNLEQIPYLIEEIKRAAKKISDILI